MKTIISTDNDLKYTVNDRTTLERVLIMGDQKLTPDQEELITNLLEKSSEDVLRQIEESAQNAQRMGIIIETLACVLRSENKQTRTEASLLAPKIVRTGTHLLQLVDAISRRGGWGRAQKRAIAGVFEQTSAKTLALWRIKYNQRFGRTLKNALNLSHPRLEGEANAVAAYITRGKLPQEITPALRPLEGMEKLKKAQSGKEAAELMEEYALPIECVPTELRTVEVYEVAAEQGGSTWLLRNLSTLARVGLTSASMLMLISRKLSPEQLKAARIHPLQLLITRCAYQLGYSTRNTNTWPAQTEVVRMIDEEFEKSLSNLEPTGLRFLHGLDVSGSMTMRDIQDTPGLTPHVAATGWCLAMTKSEPHSKIMGFSRTIQDLEITNQDSLETALEKSQKADFGSTNPGALIEWAMDSGEQFDVFIIHTDNDVNTGTNASELLKKYRAQTGINAKMVVISYLPSKFSIADPNDAGMLDISGLDNSTPEKLRNFLLR